MFYHACRVYQAAAEAEARGETSERRGAPTGKREPTDKMADALDYALSRPETGAGRGRKGRWQLAVERFFPEASAGEQKKLVRRLKRLSHTGK
jgi:hypothetical protein